MMDLLLLGIVKSLAAVLLILPEKPAYAFAKVLTRLIIGRVPRFRKVAERNMEVMFPETTPERREELWQESLDTIARSVFWMARTPLITKEKLDEWCEPEPLIEVLNSCSEGGCSEDGQGKGTLLLTLHAGVFELGFHTYLTTGRRHSALARELPFPSLERWIKKRRQWFGRQTFSRRGAYNELCRRLSSGEDVFVLFDQNVKSKNAIFVDFFGIPAATSKPLALAALRTGAPVVLIVSLEPSPKRCTAFIRRVRSPQDFPGTTDEKVLAFLTEANKVAEEAIRQYPGQWLWMHRRFKTRPPGEPETFYD